MPIAFFGTDTYAAPGEGYGAHPLDAQDASPATHDPSLLVAFLPLLMVLVMNVAMTLGIIRPWTWPNRRSRSSAVSV